MQIANKSQWQWRVLGRIWKCSMQSIFQGDAVSKGERWSNVYECGECENGFQCRGNYYGGRKW